MGNVQFESSKVLFSDDDKVAMHEDCCCIEYVEDDCECSDTGEMPKYAQATWNLYDCYEFDEDKMRCEGSGSVILTNYGTCSYRYPDRSIMGSYTGAVVHLNIDPGANQNFTISIRYYDGAYETQICIQCDQYDANFDGCDFSNSFYSEPGYSDCSRPALCEGTYSYVIGV